MTRNLRILRYLRHPYLISRAVFRTVEVWESKRHKLRLSEYNKYLIPFDKSIAVLVKSNADRLTAELESSDFLRHMEYCVKQLEGTGSIDTESGMLLYSLTRILRAEIVIETGVAKGISSSFILKDMDQNNWGKLYSIDLHYREGVTVPLNKKLGWAIPEELKYRWTLLLGESTKVLPKLLREIRKVDIFFHDSRHSYKTMMSEYKIVWPYLRVGGLLLSDDATSNDAFLDFADSVKQKPIIVFSRIGAICKSSKT